MSRLPGGIFVGVVTLSFGLIFAQFDRNQPDHTSAVEPVPAPAVHELVNPGPSGSPTETHTTLAADDRSKS